MNTNRTCPQCGAALSAESPEGLCPACLMKAGLPTSAARPVATPTTDPLAPAEIAKLFPQLEILDLLGRGGMGVVYKARQKQLDRIVALKVLPPEVARDPHFAERFLREARALARLNHPNIVTVHEFGETGRGDTPVAPSETTGDKSVAAPSLFYLIMEFVDGVNLRQLEQSRQLTPAEALSIIPKICDALQYAHEEGVVHRDIKPENILVDKKGRVKIADFGLAKLAGLAPSDARLTQSNLAMGTPHYMAPEQMEKPLTVDHRADIYSLGVVFYEMLTGELPIGRFAPPSQKFHLDVRLDEVVLKSLEKEPDRRYQHVSEVKTAVEVVASTPQAPVATPQVAAPPPPPPAPVPAAAPPRPPQFCKLGLIGTIWAVLGFIGFPVPFIYNYVTRFYGDKPAALFLLLLLPFLLIALTAPFGATILGGVAVSRIKKSAGQLTGLGLAAVSLLCYPLLAFGAVVMVITSAVVTAFAPPHSAAAPLPCVLVALVACCVAGWAAWRAITRSAARAQQVPNLGKITASAPAAPQGVVSDPAAKKLVKGPAIGLLVTAIVNWIGVWVSTSVWTFLILFHKHPAGQADPMDPVLINIGAATVWLVLVTTLITVGALKMKRLESYGWAIAASIVAILGGAIGLPFGIWALVVLSRPEVRAAFSTAARNMDKAASKIARPYVSK
ncbi:MAG: serine/threonine-protein kinase [Verrucomicrobia bacterium]|nr:serine/threonine-protein kinase [Verrucomicrobiota bacterium]